MPKVTASSWQRVPFREGVAIHYAPSFNADELARLHAGLIPEGQEGKWFVYFEDPYLYFHHSWTGQPWYRLRLQPDGGGARVVEALWSADLAAAPRADPDYAAALLDYLIACLFLGQSRPAPRRKEAGPPRTAADDLEHWFAPRGVKSGNTLLLPVDAALDFIEALRPTGTPVLGVDCFKVSGDAVEPLMDHILDLSSGCADSWSEAAAFVAQRRALGFHFEIVA